MKYLKTYEGIFDFLKKEENVNDKILDDLIDIDVTNIEVVLITKNIGKIICIKNNKEYKIIILEYNGSEFDPVTKCHFFINDEHVKASKSKIFNTYVELKRRYTDFHKSIKKYNL